MRDDVEEIGRAAERAAALTRQLLMFSRREVVHAARSLDVGALVRDLERLLDRTLSERVALRIDVRARRSCRSTSTARSSSRCS